MSATSVPAPPRQAQPAPVKSEAVATTPAAALAAGCPAPTATATPTAIATTTAATPSGGAVEVEVEDDKVRRGVTEVATSPVVADVTHKRAKSDVAAATLTSSTCTSSTPTSTSTSTSAPSQPEAKVGETKVETKAAAPKDNALAVWSRLREQLADKRICVFLDYDGTLTPIVDNPGDAKITDEMRTVVDNVGKKFATAIVTGRRIETITDFLRLEHLYYAGSHGFDIRAPGAKAMKQVAEAFLPSLQKFFAEITDQTKHIRGALVEDNTFSISVHYRNVATEQDEKTVETLLDALLLSYPGKLRKALGKKVFEVRPCFDWDKGKAVHYLLTECFATTTDPTTIVPVCIGDDVTDEDAFRMLRVTRPEAVSIHVRPPSLHRETDASYVLDSIDEVQTFLTQLTTL